MTPSILKNVLRIPKQRSRQVRTRISYMTSEQLQRFLQAAKEFGPREHAMFLFAVAHGARASEICSLRMSDINFQNEQIHIARLKGSLASTQRILSAIGAGGMGTRSKWITPVSPPQNLIHELRLHVAPTN